MTTSARTSVRCATRHLLMWETCRSTSSFTQVKNKFVTRLFFLGEWGFTCWAVKSVSHHICIHPAELWSFTVNWLLIFVLLSQERSRSCAINVVGGSIAWTICALTSRLCTKARPAWSGWWCQREAQTSWVMEERGHAPLTARSTSSPSPRRTSSHWRQRPWRPVLLLSWQVRLHRQG